MAYWIEVHCDNKNKPSGFDLACYSQTGRSPGIMAHRQPEKAIPKVRARAIAQGWLLGSHMALICPNCQKWLKKLKEESE